MIRWTLLIGLIVLSGCSSEKEAESKKINATLASESSASKSKTFSLDSSSFTTQVGIMAYTSLSQANQAAQLLDNKLASFMHHPNPATQSEVQQAWRNAYDHFLASLIYSYIPSKDPTEWQKRRMAYQDLLIQLDSWPIEGGYIDYVEGYPFSGIVNDLTLTINEQSIRTQHGFTDSSNASLGYHALEFMLWGERSANQAMRSAQDFVPQENTAPVPLSDAEQTLNNPHTDGFSEEPIVKQQAVENSEVENSEVEGLAAEESITPPITVSQNHNRRRQYTGLISELLLQDIDSLQRRWEPSRGYYAQVLQQGSDAEVLRAAFIAAQDLLSEEILTKRFKLTSSEFSHSSHDDLLALLSGLESWFKAESINLLGNSVPEEDVQVEDVQVEEPPKKEKESYLYTLIKQSDENTASALAAALLQTRTCIQQHKTAHSNLDQCKQDTIQLLSHLRRAAKVLAVNLPALD